MRFKLQLDDRERLARLVRGGSRQRPIVIGSAAVVETRVAAMTCPRCGGTFRLLDHVSEGAGQRRVDAECRQCSTPRSFWFRLSASEPN
jgi:hypothetical protein